jgi:Ca2+-transporting ATPase
VFAK